jgi:hypothetical protein
MKEFRFLSWLASAGLSLSAGCGRPEPRPVTVAAVQVAMAAPQVGAAAPHGILERSDGNRLDLSSALQGRSTLLVFYRGFW